MNSEGEDGARRVRALASRSTEAMQSDHSAKRGFVAMAAHAEKEESERRKRESEIFEAIRGLMGEYLALRRSPADALEIELNRSSYGEEELAAAVEVMLQGQFTMGTRVREFERAWSQWLGAEDSYMVNSGSSANLTAISAFAFAGIENHLKPGDEVIVPAVAWSTSVFPVGQAGCIPVFVDADVETLNLSAESVEEAITEKTRGIIAVHVLGNPCPMPEIMETARRHDLLVLEDCCEAHGGVVRDKKVGTFGDLSSFSFFFSHHITTIEGGVVCTCDRARWGDLIESLRAHGWVRNRSDREKWEKAYPEIDGRWLFVTPGYNLRATEVSAALGLAQLRKLPSFIESRQRTHRRWCDYLRKYEEFLILQKTLPFCVGSAFGFSVIVRDEAPFQRSELQRFLQARGIQTRPLLGGNFARQPAMKYIPHRIAGKGALLTGADLIHRSGFMIAIHHNITALQEGHVLNAFEEFFEKRRHRRKRDLLRVKGEVLNRL